MKSSVRTLVFNADEAFAADLRADLLSIPGVQIVATVDDPALLRQTVEQFPAEVLVVHLDPQIDAVLPAAAQVAETHPSLAVLVVSASTEGGHILAAMRAGVKEFLSKPVDRELLAKAVGKVSQAQETSAPLGKLVSVMGVTGGVGASWLAANLAVELADLVDHGPVALVDLDFRYGQLATMLDLQADHTIADLCGTAEQLDAGMVKKAMIKHNAGIEVLARPHEFEQADLITAAHCSSLLSSLQQMYPYVVVDGPNRFDPGGLTVIDMADITILLIQLLITNVRNAHRMLDALRGAGYDMGRFWLVCNRVGKDSGHLDIKHVEKTLDRKVLHQIPDEWKTVSEAINMGAPLIESAPKSRARAGVRELAEHIVHPERFASDDGARKGGLLGKVFRTAS